MHRVSGNSITFREKKKIKFFVTNRRFLKLSRIRIRSNKNIPAPYVAYLVERAEHFVHQFQIPVPGPLYCCKTHLGKFESVAELLALLAAVHVVPLELVLGEEEAEAVLQAHIRPVEPA